MPTAEAALKTHSFYSRGRGEKLIRQPLDHAEVMTGGAARRVKVQDRVVYDFAPDGRLTVFEGQDVLADGPIDPETLEPTWQDALAWLRAHTLLNERFWHEGFEPGRPLPTETDFLALVTDAVAALEVEPIEVALGQERDTHNRPVLIGAAERALGTITKVRRELAEQQAEAADAKGAPAS